MANTQTTVPTFISGQVLEAEQLNNSARTGVPVFATTVTRDAGFGGAGEKTLAEGQLCYLESTNVVQYYDGAAWATLGPAPAATSGLTLISSGSVGTSTTFSLPASSFNATYLNYLLMLNSIKTNGGGDNLMLRMRASGTDDSSANYYAGVFTVDTGGTYAGVGGMSGANQWRIGSSNNTALGVTSGHVYFMNPQTVNLTSFGSQQYTSGLQTTGSGRLDSVTQYDSATLFTHNAASFNGGTYRLYGLAD
jgi:hypothetical protein